MLFTFHLHLQHSCVRGFRYCAWELRDGQFHYFEHPVHLRQDELLERKYLIQTEEQHLSELEAVGIYKDLGDVERAFCSLKDVIDSARLQQCYLPYCTTLIRESRTSR